MSTAHGIDRSGASGSGGSAIIASLFELGDPGADRILFWDDSATSYAWLTAGSGLSISDTTLATSGLISASVVDAKGDLLVGTAADTVARKAVGSDTSLLASDSSTSDGLAWIAALLHGQCRFDYVSTSVCRLNRYNGKYLVINGKLETIPSAGVDLANTGLASNDTTYLVYAYMSSGTMTLEASATAHATDSTTGVEIKSGDATRTLVGIVRKTGGNFVYTDGTKFVASWFNQRNLNLFASASTNITTTPTILLSLYYLQFGGSSIIAVAQGSAYNLTGNDHVNIGVGVDTAVSSSSVCSLDNGKYGASTASIAALPAEGYHTVDLTAGTTYNTTVGASEYLSATVRG